MLNLTFIRMGGQSLIGWDAGIVLTNFDKSCLFPTSGTSQLRIAKISAAEILRLALLD